VLGISSFWDQAIWGFLLLVAIALDQTITERLTSALRSRKPGSRKPRNAGSRNPGPAKPGITSSPSSTRTRHA
jgi:hypothetical protein